jgi:hypothetical protein
MLEEVVMQLLTGMACFQCGTPECWNPVGRDDGCQCFYYPPAGNHAVTSERCVTYRKSAFYAHTYNPKLNLSFSTTNLPKCPNKVNRRRLKDIGEHIREDVLINYGHQYQHSVPAFMGAMINKLNEERQDIRKWATDAIKTKMLDKAIVSNMHYRNERVKKFQDIGASWKEDPASNMQKRFTA